MQGKIKWFNYDRMYGFIESDDGLDYFCHLSECNPVELAYFETGTRVQFDPSESEKGLLAKNIVLYKGEVKNI